MYPDSPKIKHFIEEKQSAKSRDLKGQHQYVEVRYDDESCETVDEIVTTQVHLEGMSESAVWMDINGLHVWFHAKRVKGQREPILEVTCFPNTCTLIEVKKGNV